MRKVSEYEEHAAECRQMARRSRNANQKKQLEEMALAWEMLASERRRLILKQVNGDAQLPAQIERDAAEDPLPSPKRPS